MMLITAIIKPGKLDDVMRAATEAGARGWTPATTTPPSACPFRG
jgi:nitrogen regulatory protein PII